MVIAVIGVLAGAVIAIINPSAQLARARDAQRKNDLRVIHQALEEYRIINGRYPQASNTVRTCAYDVNCYVHSTEGDDWIQPLLPFMKRIPKDPKNNSCCAWTIGNSYSYGYGNVYQDGQTYDLVAKLENLGDSDRCGIKDYRFALNENSHWCQAFGGSYSDQLYKKVP